MASRQHRDTLHVIAVFMRYENRREIFRLQTESSQPRASLAQRETTIDQQVDAVERNHRAVAATAAAERRESRAPPRRRKGRKKDG